MKPKTVLVVAVAVVCIGDVIAQDRDRLNQVRLRLTRPNDWGVVQSIENELKDVWVEPDEDFKQLTERAMQDDPQALYALSQVCKEKGLHYRTWSKYLNRSAELGYVKAQLRLALNRFCEGSFRGDTNELQTVRAYCTSAINTGYLCVTNLIPLVDKAIRNREEADREEKRKRDEREQLTNKLKEAERERDQRLQANECAWQNKECAKIPGVTAPLVPFEEKDKIPYEDAFERAKKNDAEAYYWLAYYFSKGEGVEKNCDAAGEFLQKAADAGHAKACYLVGLHHACYSLYSEGSGYCFMGPLNPLLPREDIDEIRRVFACGDYYFTLKLPSEKEDDCLSQGDLFSLRRRGLLGRLTRPACCFTNEVATGYVINWLLLAANGGLSYATNDVARIKRAANECKKQIETRVAAENAKRAKTAEALDLLVDKFAKEREEEEQERRRKENECQREYWSSWPRDLSNEEYCNLLCDAEKKYNSVILGSEYLVNSTRASSTNTWNIGCGKNLVKADECFVRKIDKEGRVVWLGGSERANDVEEIRWYNEERTRLLEAKRASWAEEHGMTVEEAVRKYDEWLRQPRSSLTLSRRSTTQLPPNSSSPMLGSLRERRAAREARVAEREEQRRQLEQIREELRMARESRQVQEN